MKIGELYMIEYKGGEEALENMYNGGQITFKQLQKMKVPSPGVLLGFIDDKLSQEARSILEARLKDEKALQRIRDLLDQSTFDKVLESWTNELERQPDPRAYGIFMYDGEIQCKLKLSDVTLTKV